MDLVGTALRNPINRAILQRLPLLGAPQCWLVAGCIYQVAWNERAGHTPQSDIKDYDIFHFDDADLSYEAEDAVIQRGRVLFADLDGLIEIRNQARVHLWYPQRFGAHRLAAGASAAVVVASSYFEPIQQPLEPRPQMPKDGHGVGSKQPQKAWRLRAAHQRAARLAVSSTTLRPSCR
jgi:hypothetical protein